MGADGNPVGGPIQVLNFWKARLADLEARKYLSGHPDVIAVKKQIAEWEKKAEDEALQQPVSRSAVQVVPPAELARRNRIASIRAELDQLNLQMNSKLVEEKRLRGEAMKLQARIDATPAVESEMTNITRDYTQLNAQYASLLAKREDSKLAANLERRQIGEQFTLLDAARVPERPFKPDRQLINLMGMVIGPRHRPGVRGAARVPGLELQDRRRDHSRAVVAGARGGAGDVVRRRAAQVVPVEARPEYGSRFRGRGLPGRARVYVRAVRR